MVCRFDPTGVGVNPGKRNAAMWRPDGQSGSKFIATPLMQ
jgi:hypothetical protein